MSVQIQDKFIYGDEVYEIAPMFEVPPCKSFNKLVESLTGFRSADGYGMSTTCCRGYVATFGLDGSRLVLRELKTDGGVFENQNHFISFNGEIVLKKGLLCGYSQNWSPTYYCTAIKLMFKDGILVDAKDISEENQKERERLEVACEKKRIEKERIRIEKENNLTTVEYLTEAITRKHYLEIRKESFEKTEDKSPTKGQHKIIKKLYGEELESYKKFIAKTSPKIEAIRNRFEGLFSELDDVTIEYDFMRFDGINDFVVAFSDKRCKGWNCKKELPKEIIDVIKKKGFSKCPHCKRVIILLSGDEL